MNCNTYIGELNRMTQYKDKVAKGEKNLSGGIYTYPTLMSADILIYDPQYVPVGEDQKQHVELTRDVAQRFNNKYGKTFTIPEPLIPKIGARIMSLQDPTTKMSKSDHSDKGCIYLLDDLKKARKKIMSAKTDDLMQVNYDPINQPGVSNLIQIYSSLTDISFKEIENKFVDSGYGDFKKEVANVVCNKLEEIQTKYNDIINSRIIEEVLAKGKEKAEVLANAKLDDVQKKIGIEIKM
jgi:tryptophanyl-tRNA synthetase